MRVPGTGSDLLPATPSRQDQVGDLSPRKSQSPWFPPEGAPRPLVGDVPTEVLPQRSGARGRITCPD